MPLSVCWPATPAAFLAVDPVNLDPSMTARSAAAQSFCLIYVSGGACLATRDVWLTGN